jgi:ribonuclease HI
MGKGEVSRPYISYVEPKILRRMEGTKPGDLYVVDRGGKTDQRICRRTGKSSSLGKWRHASVKPILPSICVDAACNGSPGTLEYRGVFTATGDQIFHYGPFPDGTNNVGEFLAIVIALTWMEKHKSPLPIYSDSENGISWVYQGKCKTSLKHTLRNAPLFAMIHSAENWLAENELEDDTVLKWDTNLWGEIPADFGRK